MLGREHYEGGMVVVQVREVNRLTSGWLIARQSAVRNMLKSVTIL